VNYSILTYVLLLGSVAPLLLAAWMFGTIDWTPWLILLAVGILLAFAGRRVFAALSLRLHRVSGGWFVWAAVPLWTVALGLFLNVQLDSSPAEEHPSHVVQITGGKGPRVHLQDFRGPGTISMHRNNPLVSRVSEGQAVTIVAHRGFFGWAWIAAIR
jgi:hypothetical protein